jgi:hypothetical protein
VNCLLLEKKAVTARTRPARHKRSDELFAVTYDLTVDQIPLLAVLPIPPRPLIQRNGCSIDKADASLETLGFHDIRNLAVSIA